MTTENKPEHGIRWRLLSHLDGASVETENQGTFDELVVDDWLHIEQMDTNVWWLRVGDARLMVTLATDGRPSVDVERGTYVSVRPIAFLSSRS
jgi:hypothetical protein